MYNIIEQIQIIFGQHLDKFAHLGISGLIYLILYTITRNELFSIIITFVIGIIKEVLDITYYPVEIGDIVANIVGIVIAVICVRVILKD